MTDYTKISPSTTPFPSSIGSSPHNGMSKRSSVLSTGSSVDFSASGCSFLYDVENRVDSAFQKSLPNLFFNEYQSHLEEENGKGILVRPGEAIERDDMYDTPASNVAPKKSSSHLYAWTPQSSSYRSVQMTTSLFQKVKNFFQGFYFH